METYSPKLRKHRARRWNEWTKERSRIASAAKARYRMEREYVEPEPRMMPFNRFMVTVRDRITGESGSFELVSVRDAAKRLAVVLRFAQ